MKVEVLKVFYDTNGLHHVGEITEVDFFDAEMMKEVKTKAPKKETEKPAKK